MKIQLTGNPISLKNSDRHFTIELDTQSIPDDVVERIMSERGFVRDSYMCDCDFTTLDDWHDSDIIDYMTMNGYIVLDSEQFGNNLRESMAMSELKMNLEAGRLTVKDIEKLNDGVSR